MSRQIFVEHEEDVTSMKLGDKVMIGEKLATKIGSRGDGMDYLINDSNWVVRILNLRGYNIISDGSITPLWYSEKTLTLNQGARS